MIAKRAWMWEIKQIRLLIRASCLLQLFDSVHRVIFSFLHCYLRLLRRLCSTLVGSSMFNVCIFLFNLILYFSWQIDLNAFLISVRETTIAWAHKKKKYWKKNLGTHRHTAKQGYLIFDQIKHIIKHIFMGCDPLSRLCTLFCSFLFGFFILSSAEKSGNS